MRRQETLVALSAAILLAVAGCGGGGGSSNQSTGLIPVAPTAMAVLYQDALTLRPLVSGGVWTYKGTDQSVYTATGAPAGRAWDYDNVVRQIQGSSTSTTESATNRDNSGGDSQTVSHSSGSVIASGVLTLPDGTTQELSQVELRSPVRQGDQYTILDLRMSDAGADVDGDGRLDGVDIAVYTRVIGNETIDVPSYPQLQALRTQTTALVRYKLSATNTFTDTEAATLDVWYAPGIGPVQRVSEAPGAGPEFRARSTELLVTWDGLTRGIGYLDWRIARKPNADLIMPALAIVGFDDHALMMSQATLIAEQGVTLTKIDNRGGVVNTRDYSGINAARAHLVRVGSVVRVLEETDAGIWMHSYDSDGNQQVAQPVLLRAGSFREFLYSGPLIAGASGDTLWLMCIPSTGSTQTSWELQLQPFDSSGQPLAAPTVVSRASPWTIGPVRSSGWQGTSVFSWNEAQNGLEISRYAVIKGEGVQSPSLHALDTSGEVGINVSPLATSTGVAMLWPSNWEIDDDRLGGVTLDDAGDALRSNTMKVEYERISLPWVNKPRQYIVTGGKGAFVFAFGDEQLTPESGIQSVPVVIELRPGRGPLATDNGATLLAKGMAGVPSLIVGLSGNVLLISNQGNEAVVRSIWRRL